MLKTSAGDIVGTQMFPGQSDEDILLTRAEAAAYLRISVPSLEAWSRIGRGPKVTRVGARGVRYRLSHLRTYAESA